MRAPAVLLGCIALGIAACGGESGTRVSDGAGWSTPWGWIIAGIVALAFVIGAIAASSRRKHRAAECWRLNAADAYGQARLIECLAVREPPDLPEAAPSPHRHASGIYGVSRRPRLA